MANTEFKSNKPQINKQYDANVAKTLEILGLHAVRRTTESITFVHPAVDTGRLRASISYATPEKASGAVNPPVTTSQPSDTLGGLAEDDFVYVGTNVEYGVYVHEGTIKMAARPFLRDGIMSHASEFKEIVQKTLGEGLK